MLSRTNAGLRALVEKHTMTMGPKAKRFLMADDLVADICANFPVEPY